MRESDAVLSRKYEALLRRPLNTSNHHHKANVEVQAGIGELGAMIVEQEQDFRTIAHNLAYHDSENLVLLHEDRYEQCIDILSIAEGQRSMYYPGKHRAATHGFIHHVNDHIDIQAHNVKVLQESGGKCQELWAVKFCRKKGHKGLFHVKIYIINKKMFAAEIEAWRTREVEFRVALEEYQTNLDIFENQNKELEAENSGDAAANVEKFYLDKRTMLDDSDDDYPIPFVKNYMDPHHGIDWKLIGNGLKATPGESAQFVTRSCLPIYNVYHSDTGAHIVFDVMRQQCDNIYDYQDALGHKKTAMKFVPQDSGTSLEEEFDICFLDTRGINDTNYRDVEHSKRIIEAMVQIQSFNLIIIIVDSGFSISKEQQVAFSDYSRVIQELQGHHDNVVFVYTHTQHEHSHHSNTEQPSKMTERHGTFGCAFRSLGRMQKTAL
ncbi:hypothetical protein BG006_001430 [Podila minutissima]|uniref:Uncharacterized protein n=1 Tax=Podila minutissima TaxID=64525 RepID=A0A9P5SAC5_9FUNG|nr:hypothetical protein BG006_001430 [Podila minutissima]